MAPTSAEVRLLMSVDVSLKAAGKRQQPSRIATQGRTAELWSKSSQLACWQRGTASAPLGKRSNVFLGELQVVLLRARRTWRGNCRE